MDTILFHPETSTRRALILALGTYGSDALSPAKHQPLVAKLLDLYERDPDAGIHGAAEWTLRQWQQSAKVDEVDVKLRGKDRVGRRWFVNGQGDTFAFIEGPVEFRMGSPRTDTEQGAYETLHQQTIPQRFAIAAKEVTVARYQEFARKFPQFALSEGHMKQHGLEPDRPMIGVSWFIAAAYCNWLSEQEGIPEDQWCYIPKPGGEYDKGMTIPANSLKRRGYRLPTEAEWEYACRAGSLTSRYYGSSVRLLERYAWYLMNSGEPSRVQPCAAVLPNDLGLFDMLGNVYEWCQDLFYDQSGGEPPSRDDIIEDIARSLRGGAYSYRPVDVRSADRYGDPPTYRNSGNGFRLARTYD
jgi:formylglycine-generating enzyme required for sulfatase activity